MKKIFPFALFVCLAVPSLGLAQDFAIDRLSKSPRHHEWVNVPAGKREVKSFVVYPQKQGKTLPIIIIHENRGLTDWVRSFADQIAEAGYLAIAPDLLSGFSKKYSSTEDFENSDAARNAIYKLKDKQVTRDLKAVLKYITNDPASAGDAAVMGFCWGGNKSFLFGMEDPRLEAVLSFYGSPPKKEKQIKNIQTRVFGFYGENDNRINSKLPKTQDLMKKHGKFYDIAIYEGAGHAFMRHGDDPSGSPENIAARDKAWKRIKGILSEL